MRCLQSRRLRFRLAAPLLRLEVQRVAQFAQAGDLRARGAAVDGRIQLHGLAQRPQDAEQRGIAIHGATGGGGRSGRRGLHTEWRGIDQRVRGCLHGRGLGWLGRSCWLGRGWERPPPARSWGWGSRPAPPGGGATGGGGGGGGPRERGGGGNIPPKA